MLTALKKKKIKNKCKKNFYFFFLNQNRTDAMVG